MKASRRERTVLRTTSRSRSRRRLVRTVALLMLAALALATFLAYRQDIREDRARVAKGSQVAQTDCGPIEYAARGQGPVVLVVHGAGGGFDQGMDIADPLVAAGFRVVAMSRFGYLRTPLPADASAEAQADAHACLLTALQVGRAAVIGASAGAPSSLQLAIRHPDRVSALILLVPAVYAPRPDDAPSVHTPPGTQLLFDTALRSDFLFWAAQQFAPAMVDRAILATPDAVMRSARPAEQARVAQIRRHILPVSPRRLGLLNDAAVTSGIPRYDLERISAPTLAISVADDLFGTFDGARYTAAQIAGARFIGYPSGGHVWVGHHEQLFAEITDFLKQRSAPPE